MPTEETACAKAQRYGRNTVTQREPVHLPSLGQRRAVLVKSAGGTTSYKSCSFVKESELHWKVQNTGPRVRPTWF